MIATSAVPINAKHTAKDFGIVCQPASTSGVRGRDFMGGIAELIAERDKQRAPLQVLVLPFRRTPAWIEYALFRRAEQEGYWQGVAGGAERGESPLAAARRETREEAGLSEDLPYYRLTTSTYVPAYHFSARRYWPKDLYVLP